MEVQMVIKKIIRIILSLLGLAYGILMVIGSIKQGVPNYLLAAGGAAICIFSIGWLFNLRWAKIITGILLIPAGIAGSLWTIWDFFQDILFDKGVIGNYPLLGYGMTIFLLPYLLVLALFVWIIVVGFGLVKRKEIE
jgi:hypothetical protein